jgi:hypothetical protein
MARFHIDGGPLDLGEGAKAPPVVFVLGREGVCWPLMPGKCVPRQVWED